VKNNDQECVLRVDLVVYLREWFLTEASQWYASVVMIGVSDGHKCAYCCRVISFSLHVTESQ